MSTIVGIIIEGYAQVVGSGGSVSGADVGLMISDAESVKLDGFTTKDVAQSVVVRDVKNFSAENCVDQSGARSADHLNLSLPVRRSKYAPASTHSENCGCSNCAGRI